MRFTELSWGSNDLWKLYRTNCKDSKILARHSDCEQQTNTRRDSQDSLDFGARKTKVTMSFHDPTHSLRGLKPKTDHCVGGKIHSKLMCHSQKSFTIKKVRTLHFPLSQNFNLRKWNRYSHSDLVMNLHTTFIHKQPKLRIIQFSPFNEMSNRLFIIFIQWNTTQDEKSKYWHLQKRNFKIM